MQQLMKYDAACKLLAEAKDVDEVKAIRDQAEAMRQYARLSKNKAAEIDCAAIRIRAERELGRLMEKQRKEVGLAIGTRGKIQPGMDLPGGSHCDPPGRYGQVSDPIAALPTLAQAGISKALANRARRLAEVPADDFEATLAEHRAEQKAVTSRTMAKLTKPRAEKQSKNQALETLRAAWKAADEPTRRAFLIEIGLLAEEATVDVWTHYADAYQNRYSVQPVRNAKINSQIAQLVKRLGVDAPHVAAYYVGSNNAYYVGKGHAIGQLLVDAEKIRTEWATGKRTTTTEAKQVDRKQTTANAFAPLLHEARNGK
jgi:hypothetical protein